MPEALTKPSNTLFLAIDRGGYASRAMVIDEHGDGVAESICEVIWPHLTHRYSLWKEALDALLQ